MSSNNPYSVGLARDTSMPPDMVKKWVEKNAVPAAKKSYTERYGKWRLDEDEDGLYTEVWNTNKKDWEILRGGPLEEWCKSELLDHDEEERRRCLSDKDFETEFGVDRNWNPKDAASELPEVAIEHLNNYIDAKLYEVDWDEYHEPEMKQRLGSVSLALIKLWSDNGDVVDRESYTHVRNCVSLCKFTKKFEKKYGQFLEDGFFEDGEETAKREEKENTKLEENEAFFKRWPNGKPGKPVPCPQQ